MKAKLLVENEHGNFEIGIGDKVEILSEDISGIVNEIYTLINESICVKISYPPVGFYVNGISKVRKRHEWTNPLGNKEVAWDGDTVYVIDDMSRTVVTDYIGEKHTETKLNGSERYSSYFTKYEDIQKWVQKKKEEELTKEYFEKLREIVERPIGTVDRQYFQGFYSQIRDFDEILKKADEILAVANCDHKEYVYYKDKKYEYVPELDYSTCIGCAFGDDEEDCPDCMCVEKESILKEVTEPEKFNEYSKDATYAIVTSKDTVTVLTNKPFDTEISDRKCHIMF